MIRRPSWLARPAFQLRLTALFLLLFVVAGALVLALNYFLVQHALAGLTAPILLRLGAPPAPGTHGSLADLRAYLTRYRALWRDETLHELLLQSLVALAITASVGALGAWFLAGHVLRPLRQVTQAAGRLSQETLDERIALRGPNDELRQLADTFDGMVARLEKAFDSQRRFVANVSHELRSPLATQRTLIEVALASPDRSPERCARTLRTLLTAVDEQQRLVEALLLLAASERGIDRLETVDLRPVVSAAVRAARAQAEGRQVRIEAQLGRAAVAGHPALLARMVRNLVDNGVAYNRAGGWLKLRLSASGRGACFVVANSGPMVPRDRVESLFEPFRRLGGDRTNSTGLGLSIVRAVVLAHRGAIAAVPGPEGGLEVTIDLPGPAAGAGDATRTSPTPT